MKKIIIIPAYNEEENIGELIEEWEKQTSKLKENDFELELRIINDASKDNTVKVVMRKKRNL